MERITHKRLEFQAQELNRITGSPTTAYTRREDGTNQPNGGHYYISGAYGGWKLERMEANGGSNEVTATGFTTPRKLSDLIIAYTAGMRDMTHN